MTHDPIFSLLSALTARAALMPTTDWSKFRPFAASPSPEPRQQFSGTFVFLIPYCRKRLTPPFRNKIPNKHAFRPVTMPFFPQDP